MKYLASRFMLVSILLFAMFTLNSFTRDIGMAVSINKNDYTYLSGKSNFRTPAIAEASVSHTTAHNELTITTAHVTTTIQELGNASLLK